MAERLIVSFGGGVNSAAMLVGMRERGILPDAILFADTGGEKPETYQFVDLMRTWALRNMDLGIIKTRTFPASGSSTQAVSRTAR